MKTIHISFINEPDKVYFILKNIIELRATNNFYHFIGENKEHCFPIKSTIVLQIN